LELNALHDPPKSHIKGRFLVFKVSLTGLIRNKHEGFHIRKNYADAFRQPF